MQKAVAGLFGCGCCIMVDWLATGALPSGGPSNGLVGNGCGVVVIGLVIRVDSCWGNCGGFCWVLLVMVGVCCFRFVFGVGALVMCVGFFGGDLQVAGVPWCVLVVFEG